MRFISLFSGIGGFDLGLERAGWTCVAQVENSPFALSILRKHWPHVPKWEDIRHVDPSELPPADAVVGGFPCQPFSLAGKRRGHNDDRNLWPEMRRIVAYVRPRWVVAENVPGIVRSYLDHIADDLESLDYTVGTLGIPVAALGAPHIRERIFIVAHADGVGCQGWSDVSETPEQARFCSAEGASFWAAEPGVDRVAYGVPRRVDRVKALGNAVVPQVAELLGEAILRVEMVCTQEDTPSSP